MKIVNMLDNRYPHNNPEFDLQLDLREAINEDPLSFEAVVIILQTLIQFQPDIFNEAEMEVLYPQEPDLTIDDAMIGQAQFRGLLDYDEASSNVYLPKAAKRMFEQYADDLENGILEEDPYSLQDLQILQNRLNRLYGSRSKQ